MTTRRPIQKDVATLAQVHRSTVSLVLANHPAITKETRERVMKACRKIGYKPDPLLSQLAAYRTQNEKVVYHGTLAWFVNHPSGRKSNTWQGIAQYVECLKAAQAQADKNGYQIEIFELGAETPARRLKSILRSRNISGLLLCPQAKGVDSIEGFPFEDFSCVALGYSLVKPRFHIVTSHQFHASLECVSQAVKSGYRRIGFAIPRFHDQRVDHNYLAGYLIALREHGLSPLSPYEEQQPTRSGFARWLKKIRPDALLGVEYWIPEFLEELGIRVPDDLELYIPCLSKKRLVYPGIDENVQAIGASLVDYLIAMIRRGEKGIPATPQVTLVEGNWLPRRK